MIRASSLHRFRNCHGAAHAERDLPDSGEKSWTGDGKLVHSALENPALFAALPRHLLDVADSMSMTAEYLVDKIFPNEDGIERGEVIRERQFFIEHKGQKIISGHPDYVQIGTIFGKRVGLILDFKSGYLEVETPDCNDQIRSYAVAVWQDKELNLDEVYGCIVPRFGMMTPVHYSETDLPQALLDLVDVYEASLDTKAKRTPSADGCRYCRARATSLCPETLNPPMELINPKPLIALTPKEKGELLILCEIVAGNIKRLKERLYEELEADATAVEGWQLAPGDTRSSIPDVSACFQIVSEIVSEPEFYSCLTVKTGELKDALKNHIRDRDEIKGKALDMRVKTILEPVTVKKQGAPVLERVA
jgi:hypothetical protein